MLHQVPGNPLLEDLQKLLADPGAPGPLQALAAVLGQELLVVPDCGHQRLNALVILGLGQEHRRLPGTGLAVGLQFQHLGQFLVSAGGPLPVSLVDHQDISHLQDAGFNGLDVVPHTGDGHHQGGVGGGGDLHFVLSHPHGLHQDIVLAHGVQDGDHRPGRGGEAAEMPPGGQGADEDALIQGVALHPDAVSQDSAAGKGAGGVNRHHAHGFALLAQKVDETVGEGALAHPGRAGDADDMGPAAMPVNLFENLPGLGPAVVQLPHEARRGAHLTGQNAVHHLLGSIHYVSNPGQLISLEFSRPTPDH